MPPRPVAGSWRRWRPPPSSNPVVHTRFLAQRLNRSCFSPSPGEDGAGTHDDQVSQVGVASLGDSAQPGFAATAVLAGHQPGPGGELPTIREIMANAQAGHQGAGGGQADAGELQKLPAALVLFGGLGDGFVVLVDAFVQPVCVPQQMTDTAVSTSRGALQGGHRFPGAGVRLSAAAQCRTR